jgi:hypothetical protein
MGPNGVSGMSHVFARQGSEYSRIFQPTFGRSVADVVSDAAGGEHRACVLQRQLVKSRLASKSLSAGLDTSGIQHSVERLSRVSHLTAGRFSRSRPKFQLFWRFFVYEYLCLQNRSGASIHGCQYLHEPRSGSGHGDVGPYFSLLDTGGHYYWLVPRTFQNNLGFGRIGEQQNLQL